MATSDTSGEVEDAISGRVLHDPFKGRGAGLSGCCMQRGSAIVARVRSVSNVEIGDHHQSATGQYRLLVCLFRFLDLR